MTLCRCTHLLAHHSWDGRTQSMSCERCECKEYEHVLGYAPNSVSRPQTEEKVIPVTLKIAGKPVKGKIVVRKQKQESETKMEEKQDVQETPKVDVTDVENVKEERATPYVCGTCNSTKTAKRTSGKERWHATGPNTVICHKCYEKARKATPPS